MCPMNFPNVSQIMKCKQLSLFGKNKTRIYSFSVFIKQDIRNQAKAKNPKAPYFLKPNLRGSKRKTKKNFVQTQKKQIKCNLNRKNRLNIPDNISKQPQKVPDPKCFENTKKLEYNEYLIRVQDVESSGQSNLVKSNHNPKR